MTEPTGNALWNIFRRKNNKERLALIRQKLKLAKGKKEEIKGGEEEGDGEEGEEEEVEEEIAEVGMVKNILSVVGTLGWASISLPLAQFMHNSILSILGIFFACGACLFTIYEEWYVKNEIFF